MACLRPWVGFPCWRCGLGSVEVPDWLLVSCKRSQRNLSSHSTGLTAAATLVDGTSPVVYSIHPRPVPQRSLNDAADTPLPHGRGRTAGRLDLSPHGPRRSFS